MKKIISTLLIIILILSLNISVFANDEITVKLNGSEISFDVAPQIVNGRTMVPLRAIFESLGASVEWNGETQTVSSTKDNTTISLTIDSNSMLVNGEIVTLDSPACIVDGRTLVPVRAISEAFGTTVDWDDSTNTVFLNSYNGFNKLAEFIQQSDSTHHYVYDRYFDVGSIGLWYKKQKDNTYKIRIQLRDEDYLFALTLSKDCILSTYELQKGLYKLETVLTGSFKNATITNQTECLPYDEALYDGSENVHATRILKSLLLEINNNIPEISLASLGFTNYINQNSQPNDYDDIADEISKINSYISQGMYLEAKAHCNDVLKNYKLSPANIQRVSALAQSAQEQYDAYLKEIQESKDNAKISVFKNLLTDANKEIMYEKCKSTIRMNLNNPSTVKFLKAYYYADVDGIHVAVDYEAANSFGVYNTYYSYFVFNESLFMTKQIIPPEKTIKIDVEVSRK